MILLLVGPCEIVHVLWQAPDYIEEENRSDIGNSADERGDQHRLGQRTASYL